MTRPTLKIWDDKPGSQISEKSEPDRIVQTSEPMTPVERRLWIKARCDEDAKEVTFRRISTHPEHPEITLYEGWKVEPRVQGKPRFDLEAAGLTR